MGAVSSSNCFFMLSQLLMHMFLNHNRREEILSREDLIKVLELLTRLQTVSI